MTDRPGQNGRLKVVFDAVNHHTFAYNVKKCKKQKDPWSRFASDGRITATAVAFFKCSILPEYVNTHPFAWVEYQRPHDSKLTLENMENVRNTTPFSIKQIGLTQQKNKTLETAGGGHSPSN